jgi:hypothetical protein
VVNVKALSPNKKRGYYAAREFLYSQFFLLAGALAGLLHYLLQDSWRQNVHQSFELGYCVSLVYLPFSYIRALVLAWRVWQGHDEPEEITEEQEKTQVEACQSVLKQIAEGGD